MHRKTVVDLFALKLSASPLSSRCPPDFSWIPDLPGFKMFLQRMQEGARRDDFFRKVSSPEDLVRVSRRKLSARPNNSEPRMEEKNRFSFPRSMHRYMFCSNEKREERRQRHRSKQEMNTIASDANKRSKAIPRVLEPLGRSQPSRLIRR